MISAARAAEAIRSARRPLIVAGGGVVYSRATDALARFCERTGIPVGQSQAGKGSLPYDHPQSVGAIGSTGTTAANALAAEADLVIGIGTRYSDFTSASRTAFTDPDVRFVNINVASFDAVKQGAVGVVADARETIEALDEALAGYAVSDGYRALVAQLAADWEATVDAVYSPGVHGTNVATGAEALTQNEVIGLVNAISEPRDVVVCAAGSMPGDLHKLWRTRDPKGYHVEYGYSCMGYEVAGGLGVAMACPDRDVFVMVGDGSYLMMATELVTAVQEGVKVIVVLVQNHGFASIGSLSESLGSQRFGTSYRYRSDRGRLDGGVGRQPRRGRPAGDDRRGVRRRPRGREGVRPRHRRPRGDGPAHQRTRQRILVGRPRIGDLDARVHTAGPRGVRGVEEGPASLPAPVRTRARIVLHRQLTPTERRTPTT